MCQNRGVTCPNCGAAMRELPAEETYGRPLAIDVCDACHGLWFDGAELLQLSSGSTLALFRTITTDAEPAQPLAPDVSCPRCGAPLEHASDIQRGTRFHYARCPAGHGRFLTFFQFMRAKNFVRTLSVKELNALRGQIRQINCSNCGAPVDVERASACTYCRTPLSMIDPGQLERTLQELQDAEARRHAVDPALPLRLAEERLRAERAFAADDAQWVVTMLRKDRSGDLVQAGLRALKAVIGESGSG
jgi:Zn-finger nucleic acid-binding protein